MLVGDADKSMNVGVFLGGGQTRLRALVQLRCMTSHGEGGVMLRDVSGYGYMTGVLYGTVRLRLSQRIALTHSLLLHLRYLILKKLTAKVCRPLVSLKDKDISHGHHKVLGVGLGYGVVYYPLDLDKS